MARILVIDGKVVAVARRVPGHVVGDGRRTVAELIEVVNQDPRRGIGHEKVLTRIELSFSEPGANGLQSQLAEFWSGWDDLANRPGDPGARGAGGPRGAGPGRSRRRRGG